MTLYDIIIEAGVGAKFEILTELPVNLSQEWVARMNCLLVMKAIKESHAPGPKMRNAGFTQQRGIWSLDEIRCDFLKELVFHNRTSSTALGRHFVCNLTQTHLLWGHD
jgi:hypothetical protein